jgi:1-acyl-sn-glycerol-3-phosphate acyltransferase
MRRMIIFVAKEELFRSWFSGYFISRLGAFPVHRGRVDREALRQAERVLSRGRVLAMFPEGTRGQGHLQGGFTGAAMIATRANVPVLPIGITGTETIKGWGWMLRRPKITVSIGRPFELPAPGGKGRREELEGHTRTIMGHIAELLPPRYRGETREDAHAQY